MMYNVTYHLLERLVTLTMIDILQSRSRRRKHLADTHADLEITRNNTPPQIDIFACANISQVHRTCEKHTHTFSALLRILTTFSAALTLHIFRNNQSNDAEKSTSDKKKSDKNKSKPEKQGEREQQEKPKPKTKG